MAAHQRILLLGPTGVEKSLAIDRLNKYLEIKHGQNVTYIDFENGFLKTQLPPPRDWMTFLAQDASQQHDLWKKGWAEFKKIKKDGIVILGMHGSYISNVVGLRSAVDVRDICKDFKPTLIVTLIDDVYSMWHKTESRAKGQDRKGRPSFEQLLVARRAEQFVGDIILTHLGNPQARHIVCAAGNTLDALANLVIRDATVTYLSFPISSPREMAKNGDNSFVEIINLAHTTALARMRENTSRCFISPLSIDELPLLPALSEGDGERISFDPKARRWRLDQLWGDQDALILPLQDQTLDLPRADIDDASGTIRTDVGWRDRRLVLQANSLAIICPKPPNEERITRGVLEEVTVAVPRGIVCFWWEKPEWDQNGFVSSHWPAAGSMGIGQTQALVRQSRTLDELIRADP